MSGVDELYRRYVQEYRHDGDADPRPYLDELTGVERAELSLRIDRFLQQAPAPAFNAEAFARFRTDPARKAVVERVLNPETLASVRAAAGLTKADTAAALAERLELTGHELPADAAGRAGDRSNRHSDSRLIGRAPRTPGVPAPSAAARTIDRP